MLYLTVATSFHCDFMSHTLIITTLVIVCIQLNNSTTATLLLETGNFIYSNCNFVTHNTILCVTMLLNISQCCNFISRNSNFSSDKCS